LLESEATCLYYSSLETRDNVDLIKDFLLSHQCVVFDFSSKLLTVVSACDKECILK